MERQESLYAVSYKWNEVPSITMTSFLHIPEKIVGYLLDYDAIQFKPEKVECDMSWAILQDTTAALNGIDMKSYLQWCFEVHAKK